MIVLGSTLYMAKIIHFEKKRFITRFDVFLILIILSVFLAIGVFTKFVFQKNIYVTVELLATGGEWWWGVPPPYYWNFNNLEKGAKEYDVLKKPLVEILDIEKYGHDNRKFTWIKARLKVNKNMQTGALTFRQFPLEVGKTITISPNNTIIIANVVSIEGMNQYWNQSYRTIIARQLEARQWVVDAIQVGDTMKDNQGNIIAEILEKDVQPSDMITTTWLGEPLLKKDPLHKDVTLKIKMRVLKDGQFEYFNFYQIIQPGEAVTIQLSKISIQPHILSIE